MAQTYDQSRELLAELREALWPDLSPTQRVRLMALPEPCDNHLEVRMRRPDRASRLMSGCRRLALFDSELLLEGLRLHPHALCRAAETLGPLPDSLWNQVSGKLRQHRLWKAGEFVATSDSDGFWQAVELLERHRELPQPILDFEEAGRLPTEAPLDDFQTLLRRYLVRAKLEKARFASYAALKAVPT